MNGAAEGHENADESSSPSRQLSRLRTVVAAIVVVAVVVGVAFWIARDDASELPDSEQPATPATDDDAVERANAVEPTTTLSADDDIAETTDAPPDTCEIESSAASWQTEAPAGVRPVLAVEPVLEWKQVEPPFDRLVPTRSESAERRTHLRPFSGFHTTQDGSVAVVAQGGGANWLVLTSDGVDWEAFPLPQGIRPREAHISSDRWVVVGDPIDDSGTETDPWAFHRVLFSDDRGTTWTSVPLDPGTPPLFSEQYLYTLDLAVSADRILLVGAVSPRAKLGELLTNRGLIERSAGVEWSGFGDRSVHVLMPSDDPDGGYVRAEFSYDQLELSERQESVMALWESTVRRGGLGYARVFAGDVTGLSVTNDLDAESLSSAATRDGFVLAVAAAHQDGDRYVASPDGVNWGEVPVDPPIRVQLAGARDDGSMWAAVPWDGRSSRIAVFRCGTDPRITAALEDLIIGRPGVPGLAAGADGIVAVAAVRPEFRSLFGAELLRSLPGIPKGRVAQQGYELRLGEPDHDMALWNVTEDAVVFEWGDVVVLGAPPWVSESGIDDEYELVINDPISERELVAFSMEHLAEFIDPLRLIGSGSVTGPVWIGWSTDGVGWHWQAALDAFGFEPSRFDIEMAVGDGFVLASVRGRGDPVWFVAEVP